MWAVGWVVSSGWVNRYQFQEGNDVFKTSVLVGKWLRHHLASIVVTTNGLPCEVCRKKCLTKCQLCNKRMCTMDKWKWNGAKCAVLFHSEEFFGLARSDYKVVHGKNVSGWKAPNKQTIARNVWRIRGFVKEINDNESCNNSDKWVSSKLGKQIVSGNYLWGEWSLLSYIRIVLKR